MTWRLLAIVNLQLLGDVGEALRLFRCARRLRQQVCTPSGGTPPYRYLDYFWAMQVGHIANIEHLVKRDILLGKDPGNIILHYPASQRPANSVLLEKMGAHIRIVRSGQDLPFPPAAMFSVLEDYYVCESIDGSIKHWWHASPEIFRAWEDAGRGPLLSFSPEELAGGRAILQQLGIPGDAWFVCLHVRESGFKRAQGYGRVEEILNADIEDYLPAIREVTERGGWVVRVGDSRMRRLQPMPRVVDYAHSAFKSEWMDVFLLGACRCLIGTSSGPAYVPPLFGVPCVLTNWAPTGQRPFNRRDLYIPKLFQMGKPGHSLSLAETMAPPVGYSARYLHAERLQLRAISNSPEEIRAVVGEMLDRLEGRLTCSSEDAELQAAFDAIAAASFCFGNARIGRDFLRRHRHLLPDSAHAASGPAALEQIYKTGIAAFQSHRHPG